MTLQERIKIKMKELGLNQKQLAEKAKITEASMSKYLSGERNPRTDVVVKIAKALNTSIDYLLDENPLPSDPYDVIQVTLARCKDDLTEDEKKKLIMFLLEN